MWGSGPIKALFLHGGPGNSVDDYADVNFKILDPSLYTVLEVDQLGTGKSQPSVRLGLEHASKYVNTVRAQQLVHALIQVLDHLGWSQVYLHGGSWGSALALIFAEMHPDRVIGMVIRGIFTGTAQEMDVVYTKKGAKDNKNMNIAFDSIYDWAKSVGYQGGDNNSEAFVKFFRDFMVSAAPADADMAAWNWRAQENYAMGETDCEFNKIKEEEIAEARSVSFWEAHIFYEMLWGSDPLDILGNIPLLPKVPISIVQGKGDEVCPPTFAQALEEALKKNGYQVHAAYVDDGHKVTGNGIRDAVRDAVLSFAKNYLNQQQQ